MEQGGESEREMKKNIASQGEPSSGWHAHPALCSSPLTKWCYAHAPVATLLTPAPAYNTKADVFSYGVVIAEVITTLTPGLDFMKRSPRNGFKVDEDELRKKAPVTDFLGKPRKGSQGRCP